MKVYFNKNYVLEFDNVNNSTTPEQVRAMIAKKKPAIKNANYQVIDGNLYFNQEARRLG